MFQLRAPHADDIELINFNFNFMHNIKIFILYGFFYFVQNVKRIGADWQMKKKYTPKRRRLTMADRNRKVVKVGREAEIPFEWIRFGNERREYSLVCVDVDYRYRLNEERAEEWLMRYIMF